MSIKSIVITNAIAMVIAGTSFAGTTASVGIPYLQASSTTTKCLINGAPNPQGCYEEPPKGIQLYYNAYTHTGFYDGDNYVFQNNQFQATYCYASSTGATEPLSYCQNSNNSYQWTSVVMEYHNPVITMQIHAKGHEVQGPWNIEFWDTNILIPTATVG